MKIDVIALAGALLALTAAAAQASPSTVVPDTLHNIGRGAKQIVSGTSKGVGDQYHHDVAAGRRTVHDARHGTLFHHHHYPPPPSPPSHVPGRPHPHRHPHAGLNRRRVGNRPFKPGLWRSGTGVTGISRMNRMVLGLATAIGVAVAGARRRPGGRRGQGRHPHVQRGGRLGPCHRLVAPGELCLLAEPLHGGALRRPHHQDRHGPRLPPFRVHRLGACSRRPTASAAATCTAATAASRRARRSV